MFSSGKQALKKITGLVAGFATCSLKTCPDNYRASDQIKSTDLSIHKMVTPWKDEFTMRGSPFRSPEIL